MADFKPAGLNRWAPVNTDCQLAFESTCSFLLSRNCILRVLSSFVTNRRTTSRRSRIHVWSYFTDKRNTLARIARIGTLIVAGEPQLRPYGGSKSVLTSACEFAQDELLGQTAHDVQAHVYSKGLEYMLDCTRRTRIVSGRNGISN